MYQLIFIPSTYRTDPLVRRAMPLQEMQDRVQPCSLQVSPEFSVKHKVEHGKRYKLIIDQQEHSELFTIYINPRLSDQSDTVLVSSGYALTNQLGPNYCRRNISVGVDPRVDPG